MGNRMLYHSNALKCHDKHGFPNSGKKGLALLGNTEKTVLNRLNQRVP